MKKRKWIWIGLAVILVVSVLLLSNPQVRTNLFVRLYHDDIEEGLRINAGVPADDAVLFGYKYVNTWEGEHSMVEFLITTRGDTYYGCYYSPDDVPLAFQNTEAELTQCGHDKEIRSNLRITQEKNTDNEDHCQSNPYPFPLLHSSSICPMYSRIRHTMCTVTTKTSRLQGSISRRFLIQLNKF